MKLPGLILLALCAALVPCGCGYSTGLTLPDTYRTVGVQVFGNETKVPDLEGRMQNALTESVRSRVDARLVSPEHADLVIRGRLLDYERRNGVRSPENELLETGVRISVEAKLVRHSAEPGGKDIVLKEIRFDDESGYRVDEADQSPGEFTAVNRILRRVSDRIVLELFVPVAYERAPASRK